MEKSNFLILQKVKISLRDLTWLAQVYATQVGIERKCTEVNFTDILWYAKSMMNIIKANKAYPDLNVFHLGYVSLFLIPG